ncbi:hypothetical protein QCA50_007594 [Cerrena zonata]|uniref:Uncharacterized protein n=1 Tax=Cerrena zonata TaxID=2478898 RepID=A0AAW0G6F0_9APHY
MDIDNWKEIPGGDAFEDVTDLFDQAASDMAQGDVILSDGFTLMEAMGAFEIGEPRMDSGVILDTNRRLPFDPLTPLLPEEVCWILDRSFACEMEWHSGSTLSQTVYTLLYVHHMTTIDPDFLLQVPLNDGSERPIGLVTIVLRAAVMAMLKCCDLSWRELSKGRVFDTEDWQGEKCDVSLLEGVPAEYIIQKLDAACSWLHSLNIRSDQRDAIIDRLLLRKSLLELFRLDLQHARDRLRPSLVIARHGLHKVLQYAPPQPLEDSLAIRAVDPYITRRLPNFLPMRVVTLPSQDNVWKCLEQLLDGWSEVDSLLQSSTLSAWELTGSIRNWSPPHSLPPPYIRSLIQTCFFDHNLIAYQFPATWISERFWLESLGISWEKVSNILRAGLVDAQSSVHEVERSVGKLVLQDVRSYWFNPPRRRRYLMNSLLDHLIVFDLLQQLTRRCPFEDPEQQAIANAIPYVLLLRQLRTVLDIIFSGFHQDLYAHDERPIAYWHVVQVIEIYVDIVEEVKPVIPKDSPAYAELEFAQTYHDALEKICGALCSLTMSDIRQPKDRISVNYRKRYKWLYTKSFPSNEEVTIIPIPGIDHFFSDSEQCISASRLPFHSLRIVNISDIQDPLFVIQELTNAKNMLLQLTRVDVERFWAPKQTRDQIEFIQVTVQSCEALATALQSSVDASAETHAVSNSDDQDRKHLGRKLRWVPVTHPWLPGLAQDTT